MVRLGKLTDYAVFIMAHLANDNNTRSAKYLSDKTGIPEPTVAKILKKLSKGGVLKSIRGASGGYKVDENIKEISLLDIINLIEGSVAMVACAGGSKEKTDKCLGRNKCIVKSKWMKVNNDISDILHNVKLVDMIDDDHRGCDKIKFRAE